MIAQLISAACMLAVVILAILVIVRKISLEDAGKAIGRMFLIVALIGIAFCLAQQLLRTGIAALALLTKTLIPWLVVTVFVAIPLTLAIGIVLVRLQKRRLGQKRPKGGNHEDL